MLKLCKSFAVLAAILFIHGFAGSSALAQSINIEGSLPRDLAEGKFRMIVTISDITDAQNTAGNKDPVDAAEQFKARFKIYLNDNSTAVPFAPDATSTVQFYAQEYLPHTEEPEADGNGYKYVYYVEIIETTAGTLKTAASGGKLNVKMDFLLGAETVVTMTTSRTLEQDSFVINQAPQFEELGIIGNHKTLTVNFKVESEVDALAGTAAVKKKPSQVLVFLVDAEQVTTANLRAKKYSGTTTADTDATCTLTVPADNVGDCVVCGENTYLLEEGQAGITYKSVRSTDGTVSFSNLVNDRRYFAFMQYEPDGVKRSQCLVGVPSRNYSLTELNGADEATVVDFRCFIATAAYGSPTHAKVKYFRKFRDEVLLQIPGGRGLVNLYYQLSPPLADFIAARPALREFVRKVLDIPATILESADALY